MKPLFNILFSLLTCSQLFAQGTIMGFSVVPANPTIADNIEIHVDVQFNSGDCQVDNKGHSTNGFSVAAYAHHCTGALTVICPTTDTFQLGQLPAGEYTLDFTLTSGFGGSGCSPGIIADDTDQFQFTVSPSVGINEISLDPNFAFPNPVSNILFFKEPLNQLAVIIDIRGTEIMKITAATSKIDLSHLPKGVYFLQTESKRFRFVKN